MNPDRHARVERICEYCGNTFMARVERVNVGQGRFCSLAHANLYTKENDTKDVRGKEKGKKYWDGEKWSVHWRDKTGKVHSQGYARWWWEVNRGDVPENHFVVYDDGDSKNINPSNFVLMPIKEHIIIRGKNGSGTPHPSIAGEHSKWWRGGVAQGGYPASFTKPLKKRIKIRDDYTCQCCYSSFNTMGLDVHHIDRNINNNDEKNLVTVCKGCHKGIHEKSSKVNERILYFRSLMK